MLGQYILSSLLPTQGTPAPYKDIFIYTSWNIVCYMMSNVHVLSYFLCLFE